VSYFVRNHSISSDGAKTSGYLAYDNLVLSRTMSTDIDVHGSLDRGHWNGGISGNYYDVGWNTLLQTDHLNFEQRGTPCRRADIHHNIFRHKSEGDAIKSQTEDRANRFKAWANTFTLADPLRAHAL